MDPAARVREAHDAACARDAVGTSLDRGGPSETRTSSAQFVRVRAGNAGDARTGEGVLRCAQPGGGGAWAARDDGQDVRALHMETAGDDPNSMCSVRADACQTDVWWLLESGRRGCDRRRRVVGA